MKLKRIVKKVKTGGRKAALQGGKKMVSAGKFTTTAGKAANLYQPGSGNQAIAAGRAMKSGGRLSRETARGNTSGNRKRVNLFARRAKELQYAS